MVGQRGVGNVKWSAIADQLEGRLGKQVRERWYNHLDPQIKKTAWTEQEHNTLMALQNKLGNKWCVISMIQIHSGGEK